MAIKLIRDNSGSVLVETTLVLPMFFLVTLGTIDASYMLYEWVLANKAVYVGARTAVLASPVATNITTAAFTSVELQNIGQACFNSSGTNVNCPSTGLVVCTSTACTPATFGFNSANFTPVLSAMQKIFPRVAAGNVTISYQTNGSGFVGETASSGGLPMNVTVTLQCMTHQFYFLGALMNWVYTPPCGTTLQGPTLPTFSTTMQSEIMTNSSALAP